MTTQKQPIAIRAFDQLSSILSDGIDIHRCVAATAIAKLNQPKTFEALEKCLIDEDEDVRSDVVDALVMIEDPNSAKAVMENFLGDPCPEVKLAAIDLLAAVNHQPIIPYLLKLVTGTSEDINWDDSSYYATGWDDMLEIQVSAINALAKMKVVEAVPEIIKALNDEFGQNISHIAIPALGQLGGEGLDALEGLYKQGDAQLRRRICQNLSIGSGNDATEKLNAFLARCLKDKDGSVRYVALEKVIEANIDDNRIVAFYDDNDADIRQLVVETIGAKVPAKINDMLSDPSPMVRQAAFRAISAAPEKFEKEGFSEVVRQAIVGVPEVAGDASIAWAALIGEPSAESLGSALQNPNQPLGFRMGLIEALTLLDDAGFPYLAEAAGDENRQVRVSALTALAEIAKETSWPNNASETLLAALSGDLVEEPEEDETENEEGETETSEQEESEVAQQPSQADQTELSKEAEQDEPAIEKVAVSTLEQMMSQGVQTEVAPDAQEDEEKVDLSNEDERFIEISKMRAMKKGKVSLDVKVAPHQDVRQFAARLLGDFDEKGLTEKLIEAIENGNDELKQSGLDSLSIIGEARGKLKKRLFKAIALETEHPDRGIRMAATRCLGFISGDDVIERLNTMCGDKDVHVRLEAYRALGLKKDQAATMLDALKDEYSGVRSVGLKALAAKRLEMDALVEVTFKYDGMHRNDVVELLKQWNAQEAAEKYLAILQTESRKRDWLVAIQAIGDLLFLNQKGDFQAVA